MPFTFVTLVKRMIQAKISEEDFRFILETGRLSPSSFGFEPWKFLVIENPKIKALIRDTAWGAKDKVMDCSHFVVVLVRQPETLLADGEYVQHMMRDVHHIPEEMRKIRQNFYRTFSEQDFALTENPKLFTIGRVVKAILPWQIC